MNPAWQAVLADPDTVDGYAVLGDHLQTLGDPRGTLIGLQLACMASPEDPSLRAAEREFRFRHRHALLGSMLDRERAWHVDWFCGFPRALAMVVRQYGETEAAVLASLIERGALALVRELRLVGTANYDRPVEVLLEHRWDALHTLRLGTTNLGAGALGVPVERLLQHLPRLEHLQVSGAADLTDLNHPTLAELSVSTTADTLAGLTTANLPGLRSVVLQIHRGPELPRQSAQAILDHLGLEGPWVQQRTGRLEVNAPALPDENRDPLFVPAWHADERMFVQGERFWAIRREGRDLELRYGKRGRRGQRRRIAGKFSAYMASRAYRERIEAKRDAGFTEVWPDPTAPAG